ncbi:MAG: liaS 2 [Acidobacteria bacterium]|nr:liaS 2 [Acidobacteriota bacterium]
MRTAQLKWPHFLWSCLLWLAAASTVSAEQLPLRTYTTSDGLAHDQVTRIRQDSRGFLWLCTGDGLSRFDGYQFINYGTHEGLSLARVNDLLETRAGVYWIATNGGGVDRFNPDRGANNGADLKLFVPYRLGNDQPSNRVNVLFEDHAGTIWAGTDGGLFRLETKDGHEAFQLRALNLTKPDGILEIQDIVEDAEGSLWIGCSFGVVRLLPDGRRVHYAIQPADAGDYVWSVLRDKDGRIWMGARAGLVVLRPEATSLVSHSSLSEIALTQSPQSPARLAKEVSLPAAGGQWAWFSTRNGLSDDSVHALFQSHDGSIWLGTRGSGLVQFDGSHFVSSFLSHGIRNTLNSIREDQDGNIWVGTQAEGAVKITRHGLTSFVDSDGLGNADIASIFEGREGELYTVSGKWFINRYDGGKFTAVQPRLPPSVVAGDSGGRIIQDHAGEWWVATTKGLYLFPRVARFEDLARVAPKAIFTTREGLADDNVSRLFEDARGDIWISSYNPPVTLTKWERATNKLQRFSENDGLPPFNWANAFAGDRAGNVWLGMHNGGLVRYGGGRFRVFKTSDGVPDGIIQGMYSDRSGHLWVGTSAGGAARIDDPESERPRIETFTTANVLSSNNVRAFTEDQGGRIYITTARGVDQVDPRTAAVGHLTVDDGLIRSEVLAAFSDRHNILWFGTHSGLSRFVPLQTEPRRPPPILISALRVSGVKQTISELGAKEISGLVFAAAQNQLEIDYLSLNFGSAGLLRYQYRLEGLDQGWSAPTDQRTVNYAHLAPGTYKFLVRAWGAQNIPSAQPASVTFTIRPPFWRRWWFIALALLFAAGVVYVALRTPVARRKERIRAAALLRQAREERFREIQQVRTRIATDLHDDIGSSLTQIVLLSELAQQQLPHGATQSSAPLLQISSVSNELVETMSDIVWAINPQKDHLSDLSQRMRRFASDVFAARGIVVQFQAPATDHDVPLGANLRRELFLIFKESINNVVTHSGATEVSVDFHLQADRLRLQIKDNGRGFDPVRVGRNSGSLNGGGGNGLSSMRRRVQDLGGAFEVQSNLGLGTTITLDLPLSKHLTERG